MAWNSRRAKIESVGNIEFLARRRGHEIDPTTRRRAFQFPRQSPERKSPVEAGYDSRGPSVTSRSRRRRRPQPRDDSRQTFRQARLVHILCPTRFPTEADVAKTDR